MTSTGLTAEEVARLLSDFKALHWITMNKLVRSHIFHEGDVRTFPYASYSFVFQLSYRVDCRGNPALAFRVESATLRPRSALDEDVRDAIEAYEGTMEAIKVRRRAEQSEFVDLLPLVFSFGKQASIEPLSVYDYSPIQSAFEGPDFFFYQLQALSEKGHAYMGMGEGGSVIGQMEKRGNKWHWVPLTDEEVEAAGYDGLEFVEGDDDS